MPDAKRTDQADEPRAASRAPESKTELRSESRSSEPATRKPLPGESGDPAVHQLLARWEAHRTTLANHDQAAALADADRKTAEADVKAIRKELSDLGFEVGE